MQDKSILVICSERQIYNELTPLVSQLLPLTTVVEVSTYPDRKEVGELLAKHQPWLCLVDVGKLKDQALATISELAALNRNLQVVALLPAKDSDLILTCLRQGASEFLLRPLTVEHVQPVFERLNQVTTQRGFGRIVAVLPVKGACGASTIASSLAFQWKRFGVKRTLLADMDQSAGTLSFLLKLKSGYSYIDALSRAARLDADLWKGIVSQSQGIDVLLSPENSNEQTGELPDPTGVLRFCRQVYDNITLDLGAAYGKWNLELAAEADDLIVVTTNELPALRAAQRVLVYLEAQNVLQDKIHLVVNRYSSDAGLSREAIETALSQKVYQTVPSDYESVQRALVDGKHIAPASNFGKSLSALADKLSEPYKKKEDAGSQKVNTSWTAKLSSFWSKKK